jgi:hypothetical protein
MKAKKKGRSKQRPSLTAIDVQLPETMHEVYKTMRLLAKPPEHVRLPAYDQVAAVRRVASDHGFGFTDVTRLFGRRHNEDPAVTLELLDLIGDKAIKDPQTVYFLGATAENVEAGAYVAFVDQMSLEGHVTDFACFQCRVWRGDDYFAAYKPMSPQNLWNGLSTLAPGWQCCVCLADTCDTDGIVPMWECAHSICRECATKDDNKIGRDRIACPLCRAKMIKPFVIGDARML